MKTIDEIAEAIESLKPSERVELLERFEQKGSAPAPREIDDETFQKTAQRLLNHHAPLLKKLAQ